MRKPPEGLFARLLDSLTDMYALVLDQDLAHHLCQCLVPEALRAQVGRDQRPFLCQDLGTPFLGTDNLAVGFCPDGDEPLVSGPHPPDPGGPGQGLCL